MGRYGYESNARIKGTFAKLCIAHEKFPRRAEPPTSTGCTRRFALSCMLNDGKRARAREREKENSKGSREAEEQPAAV